MNENLKKNLSLFFGFIVIGFLFGIGPARTLNSCSCSNDDKPTYYYQEDNQGGGSNPSFKGSEGSKYNGNKCGVWTGTSYCNCYGCSSSNRDPFYCSRCGHRCDEHDR